MGFKKKATEKKDNNATKIVENNETKKLLGKNITQKQAIKAPDNKRKKQKHIMLNILYFVCFFFGISNFIFILFTRF